MCDALIGSGCKAYSKLGFGFRVLALGIFCPRSKLASRIPQIVTVEDSFLNLAGYA